MLVHFNPFAKHLVYAPRQSGRTTALALMALGTALAFRGEWVPAVDHVGPDFIEPQKRFQSVITSLAEKLGLVGLEIELKTYEECGHHMVRLRFPAMKDDEIPPEYLTALKGEGE